MSIPISVIGTNSSNAVVDSQLNSTSSATAVSAAYASAEAAYDDAVDSMVEQLRAAVKRDRPANPNTYVQEFLQKSKIAFPEDLSCRLIRDKFPQSLALKPLTVVVFGASGDLAKKKTFPALFGLYCNGLLPRYCPNNKTVNVLNIVGYARSAYTQQAFHDHLAPLLAKSAPSYQCHIKGFLSHVRYVQGDSYSDPKGYAKLSRVLEYHEGHATMASLTDEFLKKDEHHHHDNTSSKGTAGSANALPMCDVLFKAIEESPAAANADTAQYGNRLFYLALPPTAFIETCAAVKTFLVGSNVTGAPAPRGGEAGSNNNASSPSSVGYVDPFWARVVVEKPFGHDTKSSNALADALNALFTESQIFRIDHYLGKEMVQNVVSLRFANHVFSSVWSRHHIHSVQIVFKEKIGTEGRGGYFDKFGIIRDVIQNHLCQMLALVAMEKPRSLSAEDVRDEKVSLLRCVEPVGVDDVVIGQYTAAPDGSMKGYKEDEGVPANSNTPTFASMRLKINNDRWDGVPFILKAGKAVEAKSVTVRIQFKDELRPYGTRAPPLPRGTHGGGWSRSCSFEESENNFTPARVIGPNRNELVIRAQPDEAMYLKINTKRPGMGDDDSDDDDDDDGDDKSPAKNGIDAFDEGADLAASSKRDAAAAAASASNSNKLVLTELDLTYGKRFNVRIPEAYESLVNEAILGNSTNFVRRDELDASWRIFTPILHAIDRGAVPVRSYAAGSRGPPEADALVEATGYRRSNDYFYKKPK